MDLKLKAYLKATGMVLGFIGCSVLLFFVGFGIVSLDIVCENYQAIQNTLFKLLMGCFCLIPIGYIVSGIAESEIEREVQKLKHKEREEYEKQHKCDWQMRSVCILSIAMIVLAIMICFLGLCAKDENPSNPSNQSVKTLDIEN